MLLLFFLRGGDGIAETLTFYGQNAGNTMRNAIFYFISHSAMSLIYKILLCAL